MDGERVGPESGEIGAGSVAKGFKGSTKEQGICGLLVPGAPGRTAVSYTRRAMRKTLLSPILLSMTALLLSTPSMAQLDDLLVVEKRQDLSARNRLVQHLRGIKVTVNFKDASAKEVVDFLQVVSGKGTNFILSSRTMKDGDYPTVTMQLNSISIANLMAAYEEQTSLRFSYRAGMVFLKPKDEVKEFTYLRIYDVRAAVMPVKNFKPRYKFGLRGSGEETVIDEDDGEAEPLMYSAERLIDLIRDNAVKDSWDKDSTSIETMRGILLVKQSVRGHRKVQEILVKLGAIPAVRRVVVKRRRPIAKKKTVRKTLPKGRKAIR